MLKRLRQIVTGRKILKGFGILAGGLLFILLLLAFLLSRPPVRESILEAALRRANSTLPGNFTYRTASWSEAGRIRLNDVLWVDQGDTLLAAPEILVHLSIADLRQKDLHLKELKVVASRVDVPAIQSRFARDGNDDASVDESAGKSAEWPFLRFGAVPFLPSVAIDSFELTVDGVVLPAGILAAKAAGSVSLLADTAPRGEIVRAEARGPAGAWSLDRLALVWDGAAGTAGGDGDGSWGADLPWRMELRGTAPDSLWLAVTAGSDTNSARAVLAGRLARDDDDSGAIELDLRLDLPGTAELGGVPRLGERLAGVPDLAGASVRLTGQVTRDQTARIEAVLAPNAWCEGGAVRLAYEKEALSIADLSLDLPDLRCTGHGRVSSREIEFDAQVTSSGPRWLQWAAPDVAPLDSLAAVARVGVRGTPAAPSLTASLAGGLRQAGLRIDHFELGAVVPPAAEGPATLDYEIRARGLLVSGDAEIALGETLTVRATPVRLLVAGPTEAIAAPRSARNGTLTYEAATGRIELDALTLQGAAGQAELAGRYEPLTGGRFDLHWTASEAPAALLSFFAPGVADSLRAAWARDGVPDFTCRADVTTETSQGEILGHRVHGSGSLLLPGPRALAALLPEAARVGDLGPVRGQFEVDVTQPANGEPAWHASLSLERTKWLTAARLSAHGIGSEAVLDSLSLAAMDLRAAASGAARADSLDIDAVVEVTGTEFVRHFSPDLPADLKLGLAAQLTLTGPTASPNLSAAFTGRVATAQIDAPKLAGTIAWQAGALSGRIDAPDGVQVGPDRLDRCQLSLDSEPGGDLFPVLLSLDLSGPVLDLATTVSVSADSLLTIDAHSLRLRAREVDLEATGPFQVLLDSVHRRIDLRDVRLAGSMGTLTADGQVGPESADLAADFSLLPPAPPALLEVPEGLWPERITGKLRVTGPHRMSLDLSTAGLTLGDRDGLELQVAVVANDSLTARLELLGAGGAQLVSGTARLPVLVHAYPPAAAMTDDPLRADVLVNDLPLPLASVLGPGEQASQARLDGGFALRGDLSRPLVDSWLRLSFPKWPKMDRYRMEARLRLDQQGESLSSAAQPESPAMGPAALSPLPDPSGAGIAVSLAMRREDRTLLNGTATWPLTASLSPALIVQDPDRPVFLRVRSEPIPLAEFDPLLPAGVGAEGTATIRLDADGPASAPRYDGELKLPRVRIVMADGSRLLVKGDAAVTGAGRRPVLRGRIEVEQGVLRIPEAPRNLLPTHGKSLLWDETQTVAAPAPGNADRPLVSSSGAPVETSGTARPDSSRGLAIVDAELTLNIPSGLWLRGQGLDVELNGDLDLTYRKGVPAITGNLRAQRGFYLLLGRTFSVERGEVNFYGTDELNPTLDLALKTTLEQTLFRVQFTGTLFEPRLALTSEPEMAEGDIMAFLLFGRPLSDLSGDQVGLIQQRATDLMAAFGTVELETRLSQQLGVDMVQIGRGRGQAEGTSLVIGKYLSRRVLLKYEQALEDWSLFFINLEYFLSRSFKVETMLSQQSQSGLEVNWGRED